MILRNITEEEIARLRSLGNSAEDWQRVMVATDFNPELIRNSRFEGSVEIGSNSSIFNSYIANYAIGCSTTIHSVVSLACRHASTFGNGVSVEAVNENGGRAVKIFDTITAQIAYIVAMYRHRSKVIEKLNEMADRIAEARRSEMGRVGDNCRICGARFIFEMSIGNNVVIEGASLLENGTILDNAEVGVDVKARNFIFAESAVCEMGATVENVFLGEASKLSNGFTATHSLFFANSHCENGEACAIFAGPYTVSHHKSSLLIAGIFSFFNAGSGTNQSNHLFKSGAVHQAVHTRGCKFSSNAYVMSPAIEGPFTMIMGRHTKHHDTREFPFSYLVEDKGQSVLIPAANLRSFGTVRDIAKWIKRDKRSVKRDIISFAKYNPYLTFFACRAVDILKGLQREIGAADLYNYKGVVIKPKAVQSGIITYERYISAALGAMLEEPHDDVVAEGGMWVDLAGQYISKRAINAILDDIEEEKICCIEEIVARLRDFDADYQRHAYAWALDMLGKQLSKRPDKRDVEAAVADGAEKREELRSVAYADEKKDFAEAMKTGYGIDSESCEERDADFMAVRG